MKRESFLSIGAESMSGSPGGIGKPSNSVERAGSKYAIEFKPPFSTRVDEIIVDVYERPVYRISVPDERRGIDRRRSEARQESLPASFTVQSGRKVPIVYGNYADSKTDSIYNSAADILPAIFSPMRDKGKIIDTWA
jgi:hypothetical protein